jgi:hypothetical protein
MAPPSAARAGGINISSAAANLGSPGEYVWYDLKGQSIPTIGLGSGRQYHVNAVRPHD